MKLVSMSLLELVSLLEVVSSTLIVVQRFAFFGVARGKDGGSATQDDKHQYSRTDEGLHDSFKRASKL